MGAGVLHRLLQLLDDGGRGRQVGVAHAEVDDIDTGSAQPRLDRVDVVEHIGRQAADAVEIVHLDLGDPRRALGARMPSLGASIIAELWFGFG